MSVPRIVVDNSAMLPAFFPEPRHADFDAGLVTSRARALVQAIRMRRVKAYVPPSFFREFLHVATRPLDQPGGRGGEMGAHIRAQWEDLLSLRLIVVPVEEILHLAGTLVFDHACPATDAWYVATAVNADASFWMSHAHADGLAALAARHVDVQLLASTVPNY